MTAPANYHVGMAVGTSEQSADHSNGAEDAGTVAKSGK